MAACGDDDGGDDDKVVVDSGSPHDAGGTGIDATVPKDAATDAKVNIDAATDSGGSVTADADVDAAAMVDAGAGATNDAATSDATASDAASTDASSTDAGIADAASDAASDAATGDAATGDSGTTDAGPPVMPTAAGQIVISEIQAAPNGYADDVFGEWVEIYNPSATTTYNLATCTFGDKAGDADFTFLAGTLIPPHGYLALTASLFTVPLQGFASDVVYGAGSGLSSSNDGPNIVCNAVIIDKVEYNVGASFLTPSSMKGRTLQLDPSKLDATQNDLGASWCFGTTLFFTAPADNTLMNYGTPKAANVACP